jgi:hypothetical protein
MAQTATQVGVIRDPEMSVALCAHLTAEVALYKVSRRRIGSRSGMSPLENRIFGGSPECGSEALLVPLQPSQV